MISCKGFFTFLLFLFLINNLVFAQEDAFEPNNTIDQAKAVEINEGFSVVLYPEGDRDFFKFIAPSTGILKFRLVNPKEEIQIIADIYDADKKLIVEGSDSIGIDSGSTYYILIRSLYGHNFTPDPIPLATDIQGYKDSYEYNDNFKKAKEIDLPSTIELAVNPKHDRDYFKIKIIEEGYLTELVLYEESKMGEIFYEYIFIDVCDKDGNRIDSFENRWSYTGKFKRFSHLKPGTYYLKIRGDTPYRDLFKINFDFISKQDFTKSLPDDKKREDFSIFILGLGMKDDLDAQISSKVFANTLGGEFLLIEDESDRQIEEAMTKAIRKAGGKETGPWAMILTLLLGLGLIGAFFFFIYKEEKKKKKQ